MKNRIDPLVFSLGLLILVMGVVSCGSRHSDGEYFNGRIAEVAIPSQIDTLEGRELFLEDFLTGNPMVYDSIIIMLSGNYPDHYISVYNVNNNENIGDFLQKGRGPEEYIGIGYFDRVYIEDSELKSLMYAYNQDKIIDWNISRSLREGKTVADTVRDFKRQSGMGMCYGYVFRIDDDRVLARANSEKLTHNSPEYSLPSYLTIDVNTGEVENTLQLLKKPFYNNNLEGVIGQEILLSSVDRINPDGNKLVSAMSHLGMIGITDLGSGTTKWFRIAGTPGVSYLNGNFSDIDVFYWDVDAYGDNIYALYVDQPFERLLEQRNISSNTVHVFDWDGNFVKVLHLSEDVNNIAFDPVNRILYGKRDNDESLWSFPLKG